MLDLHLDQQAFNDALVGVLNNNENQGIGKRWTKGATNHAACNTKPKIGSAEAAANMRNSHLTIRGGL